jgi:hypothetical protein
MALTGSGADNGFARWRVRGERAGLVMAIALTAGSARGQTATATPPAPRRIVVSFEQRTRVETMTHPFRLEELGPTRVLALRTRLQVAFPKIVGPLGAFVELQDSRSGWNDQPFVVPARHVNHLDFTQAHLRLGAPDLLGSRASGGLLLGRFSLDIGRRRLSARNGMRNTTNAFDGAYGWLAARNGSSLRAFVSSPVRLEPYDLDRSRSDRLFWGGWLTARRWPRLRGELYALRLDESGDTVTRRRLTTLGGRLFKEPGRAEPDYEVDLAWQRGTRQSQDHRAFLAHLEAGFTFRRGRARVGALYDHVSGDPDPQDDRSGRFDTLFGARRFEYAPTGIYGPFFRANIQGPGARLFVAPRPRVDLMVAYRALWLAEARDAWMGSGLQDPTGRSGRFLGHHTEAVVRWQARRWIAVQAVWAHFFKGSYLDQAPGSPAGPDTDYFTIGFDIRSSLFER